MKIRIKNLRLRAIIGIEEWERKSPQDIIINIEIEYDGETACKSDKLEDTVDYKNITKMVINEVELSHFYLLEKLTGHILRLIMKDTKILSAMVEVDKPGALRFTDSVSVICSSER